MENSDIKQTSLLLDEKKLTDSMVASVFEYKIIGIELKYIILALTLSMIYGFVKKGLKG